MMGNRDEAIHSKN